MRPVRNDDKNIQIAVRSGIASGGRSKKNNAKGIGRLANSGNNFLKKDLVTIVHNIPLGHYNNSLINEQRF